MKKRFVKMIGLTLATGLLYSFFLICPNLLFANKYQYRNFTVFSDNEIPKSIDLVIDDAILRLEGSELYGNAAEFRLYICNDEWRFKFFTRNKNAGGVVNFLFSPNIFIRESNITSNQLIPPNTWKNPLTKRPLSYFIAHEAVHSLQREYDRFLIFRAPVEIIEGYADYIAKSESNGVKSLTEKLKNNASTMNPENGLYDKYHFYVGYLIENKGYNFERIVQEQPELEEIMNEIIEN